MAKSRKDIDKVMPTIRIRQEVKLHLKQVGEFGETYSDVIERLIEFYTSHQ